MAFFPTTELPPDTFGTGENVGLLESNELVYDPPTHTPQQGIILISYFTKSGPDMVRLENTGLKHIQLDTRYSGES